MTTLTLPNWLAPGEYRIRLVTTWQPNPVSKRSITTYSPPFTVAAP